MTLETGEVYPDQLFETEWFKDLVDRRLVAYADYLHTHNVPQKSLKVGIIGPPNRGKSLFVLHSTQLTSQTGLASSWIDLDFNSPTLDFLSGQRPWEERRKRIHDLSREETKERAAPFFEREGLLFADFPGNVHNEVFPLVIPHLDFAVLLIDDVREGYEWLNL